MTSLLRLELAELTVCRIHVVALFSYMTMAEVWSEGLLLGNKLYFKVINWQMM